MFRLLFISLISVVILSACNEETITIPDDQIAATVNGTIISKDQISQFKTIKNAPDAPDQQALEELIATEILYQAAVESGLLNDENIQAQLKFQQSDLLVRAFMRNKFGAISFSDEELIAAYDDKFGSANLEYKGRHILLKTEDEATAVIAALRHGGDFIELAKTRSTGPSGPNGGDLGWFKTSSMVPPFAAAVEMMNKGDVSTTPVQTNFGWHVIRIDDTRELSKPDFEDMRAQVQQELIRAAINAYISEARATAEVVIK